ncbi:MAG TPA: hypothetical protein VLI04_06615 [Nocardioidaceae bacterium]|nr:hypothetical protein [Nocardioidaceae bacterium]
MRTVLALAFCLSVLTGCSEDPTLADDPAVSIPTPGPEVDAAVEVAVKYVEAVRQHDAGAVYELAWSGLRRKETRAEFLARTKFGGVSDARISGLAEVGWDSRGRRIAIVPVIVTASGAPQVGRVLLLKEAARWRYFDLALPDQVPDLTDQRP